MSTTIQIIGGQGGRPFDFNGVNNGATLQKLRVWVGGWQIKAIKVWLTDGQSSQFGNPSGSPSEFIFLDGELITSLSLWGNGAGSRAGAIKFKTDLSREFFVSMTEWERKTEFPIDVGSGICVGIEGNAGSDIDCLGFKFIKEIKSIELKNVIYPTLNQVKPPVTVENILTSTYENKTSLQQEYKMEATKSFITKSSWSIKASISFTIKAEVKGGLPGIVENSGGFSLTVGLEGSYSREITDQKTVQMSFPFRVSAGKRVNATITIGRATLDLPYTGTLQITCENGSVLEFPTRGTYKGVAYSNAKIDVKEITQ